MSKEENDIAPAPQVLIVEDDDIVAERLVLMLMEHDVNAHVAVTLRDARRLMSVRHYSVLLLDRLLRDGDGLDLCAEYRQLAGDRPAYIIVLSSLQSLHEIARGVDAGADTYLTKEASGRDVIECIQKALH